MDGSSLIAILITFIFLWDSHLPNRHDSPIDTAITSYTNLNIEFAFLHFQELSSLLEGKECLIKDACKRKNKI